jgi:heme oxygenase-like protein
MLDLSHFAPPATRSSDVPQLAEPRGPLSAAIIDALRAEPRALALPHVDVADPLSDDDLHLALYTCYELHYRSFDGVDARWEWQASLLEARARLEAPFEQALREQVADDSPQPGDVERTLRALVQDDDGPPLSRFLGQQASLEQFREFMVHRSAYQLKEADPHAWAVPRIAGRAKEALMEVQSDEYGGGRPGRMHATLFAAAMAEAGLDDRYGAYLDRIPGSTLATVNLMSLFGLHRRLRGAIVGHLAVFEMTSPAPNRRYATGLRRLGLGARATEFFDEHVEADAVHEAIAAHDLAEGLATAEPELAADIVFGARALLLLEARFAAALLGAWSAGQSSLRA